MAEEQLRVLLVDDEASLREPLAKYLRNTHGYHVDTAADAEEALRLSAETKQPYDVALVDDLLVSEPGAEPEPTGIELMGQIREYYPETECIIFTGWGMERALAALRAGAYRYLAKPLNLEELGITIRMAAEQARLRLERDLLSTALERRVAALEALYEAGKVVTSSLALDEILSRIAEQTWNLISYYGKPALFSYLTLVENNRLKFATAYPPEYLPRLQREGDIDLEHDERICVTVRAVKTHQSQLVSDVTQDPDYIEYDSKTRSELAVPIKAGKQIIGVINVEHPDYNAFTEEDQRALESLAAQAAVAIENARLYERLHQEAKQLALINQVAAEISSSLDLKKILQTLVDALAQVIEVEQCAIAIFDERGEYGDVVAEYLEEGCVPSTGASRIPLRDNPAIDTVRKTKKPLAVKDAQHDPRMERVWDIMKRRRTQSTMIVPIVIADEIIGTIGLDAVKTPREFTKEEQWLAETIAHHAAIAIQNARQYEELMRTKGLVGARTALAWMGMTSSAWRHALDRHALTIREQVQLLRMDLQRSLPNDSYGRLGDRLAMLERLATQIIEKPVTPPLSSEEGVTLIPINDLVSERVGQLWKSDPYKDVHLKLDLKVDDTATVLASPEWLRRALDILVDNAVEAVARCEIRQVTIATRPADDGAEIAVSDTARGISPEVFARLFFQPIERPPETKGLGMGLLMAQTIVQTYGGVISVESTGPTGTTMVIWLPLAQQENLEDTSHVSEIPVD